MTKPNPFKKATRGKQAVSLLVSGDSGGGKTLTAIQIACHMAHALGRPGSVAVIDSEDGSAVLYAFDSVLNQPTYCSCEQCQRGDRIPLEFDHLDLRDHNPDSYREMMRAACEIGYAVLVIDSASHEWVGVNGCLEEVDLLKGDGRGRSSDNAWKVVTAKHNAFLADLRACPIHLIATARMKPNRKEEGAEQIVQREKDGPFEYEFKFWGTISRSSPGGLHIKKSRSGHFSGKTWKKAGRHAAEQLLLWAGHLHQDPPAPKAEAAPARAKPAPRPKPKPAAPAEVVDQKTCKHPAWSAAELDGATGASCAACGLFREDEQPPAEEDNGENDLPGNAEEPADNRLAELVEATAALLVKIPDDIAAPYRQALTKAGDHLPQLSNVMACVEQVALIAECIALVDDDTATQWKNHLVNAGTDLAKLEKMAPWCRSKLPAPTTA
jgi:hypothetical protein